MPSCSFGEGADRGCRVPARACAQVEPELPQKDKQDAGHVLQEIYSAAARMEVPSAARRRFV